MKKLFNFGDFIKESVDSNGLIKYSFSFPVTKKYQLKDDGTWTWDEICDFLKRNGTDLRSDVEGSMELEEGEEREVTDDDIDDYVNKYNMRSRNGRMVSGGWQDFKNDYGLDFEGGDLEMEDYREMMNDFNESDLEQYFDFDDYQGEPFELYNLQLVEPKRRGFYGKAEGTFETNIELNEDQIKSIKDYITGQCSDGWGEGFEQQSRDEEMDGLNFETSIHPWSFNNWNVTISKI